MHTQNNASVAAANRSSASFPVANANASNSVNSPSSEANTNKKQPTHAQICSCFHAASVHRDRPSKSINKVAEHGHLSRNAVERMHHEEMETGRSFWSCMSSSISGFMRWELPTAFLLLNFRSLPATWLVEARVLDNWLLGAVRIPHQLQLSISVIKCKL
jgi:hypothetical protein